MADHRRAEFASAALLLTQSLAIGASSERLAIPARRLLPNATVSPFPVQRVLDSGSLDGLDALVVPMDQAYYVSRVQPAFAAVVPEGSNVRAVLAYTMPRRDRPARRREHVGERHARQRRFHECL